MMIAALGVVLCCSTAPVQESREVLCLYDSTERDDVANCEIHLYAEVALNYLGLLATYHDVNAPLPGPEAMRRYRGIVTWFTDRTMKKPLEYWSWLGAQVTAGRKVVIIGELGATTEVPPEFINEALQPMGLTYHGGETDDLSVIEVIEKHPMIEFERSIDRELRGYIRMTARPGSEVFLKARLKNKKDSDTDLLVVTRQGGFSWIGHHYDPRVLRDQWRLDPYVFFAKAFGLDDGPKLDLATAMGRRIFFTSIDGDGMSNRVQPGPKTGRMAGEVVRDDFIKKYDLPVTASVIAGDLEESPDLIPLAKSILSLPNVEVAAHGFYHPINWTEKIFPAGREKHPFDLEKEVVGAVRAIQGLTPKPVKIYLWTGDCDPPPEAIDMLDRLGIANMNGFRAHGRAQNYEALTNLRPTMAPRNGRIQYNSRATSENNLTELWSKNFFAVRNLILSYQRSGAPRRIHPIHIYFHYYVVEQPAGEAALQEIYDWALTQQIYPMTAAEYVAWVKGFASGRIERLGPGSWRIRNYGACRTLRFDDRRESVDLSRSSNVVGFRQDGSTLYVHLGPGDEARVTLGRCPADATYVMESNGQWDGRRIEARTAVEATFMTPRGVVRRKGAEHVLEVDLK